MICRILTSLLATLACCALAAEPTTIQDQNFPLIRLPMEFRAQRQSTETKLAKGQVIEIFKARGAGCVRHIWLCPNIMAGNAILKIYADGAAEPQVNMEMQRFLGVLLGQQPYRVDCAVFQHLPMTEGPVQGPGYNCYLPIPFRTGCRITLEALNDFSLAVQVDWQQYAQEAGLTPYRLHAVYHGEFPARHRASFPMADISGRGFVAGIFKGIRQRDFSDMIYHTKGQLWLIDGETDPHAINGHNEEDDFSFFWGYQRVMTPWIGCPYHRWSGRENQDGVIYRFFGLDPVPFRSSLVLRCGSRADDKCWWKFNNEDQATSRIGLAWSEDGRRFTRHPTPVVFPDNDAFTKYEWPGGCQDVHVVEGEDSVYYMNYTAWGEGGMDSMCGANWHPGEPAGGYCGIQHNGPEERRTIFSIWDTSPQLHPAVTAADPGTIFNRFGGEGTGSHTHMAWNWKIGETFQFFVRKQVGKNPDTTDTRYYVFDRHQAKWLHSATITSPNGGKKSVMTIGGGLNSFLENFGGKDRAVPKIALYRLWLGPSLDKMKCLTRARGDGTWGQLHDAYFLAEGDAAQLKTAFSAVEKDYGKPEFGSQGGDPKPISDRPVPAGVLEALKNPAQAKSVKEK